MKKEICYLLFLTACASVKNSSITNNQILKTDLPVNVIVKASYLADGFKNKLISELKNKGYTIITTEEIQRLTPQKTKEAYNKHKSSLQQAKTKEEHEEKFKAMLQDESMCWYSSVSFKLIFKVDTINNSIFTDTALVSVLPMPYMNFQKKDSRKTFSINQEHLKEKSLDKILFMLIDSITLPRK